MNIPAATYRIQLNRHFTMGDAAGIVEYVGKLGISHMYFSPILQARAGSTHGYDMVDFRNLNTEICSESEVRRLAETLKGHGIGWIQDIVPNHMAYDGANPYINDILRRGLDSEYSGYFDIIWDRSNDPHPGKLCAPFLGMPAGKAISSGDLHISNEHPGFLSYFGREFPLSDDTWKPQENGTDGLNTGTPLTEELLSKQNYSLESWKNSMKEINYRRFFSINDLIGLKEEDRKVFDEVHRTIIGQVDEGIVQGLRIDHVDGLADPEEYLQWLSEGRNVYTVVEKILAHGEELAPNWRCQGTTGYDFLGAVSQVLTMKASENEFDLEYGLIAEEKMDYWKEVQKIKGEKLESEFRGDLDNAVDAFMKEAYRGDSPPEGFVTSIRRVFKEMACSLGVYRTYSHEGNIGENGEGALLGNELLNIKRESPELSQACEYVLEYVKSGRRKSSDGLTRFRQLCAPAMAKSGEDTMFFRYSRLISLNEVGNDPSVFGISVDEFHRFMKARSMRWPNTMNTTSTHDTKLGEDGRALLSVISEIPSEWFRTFRKWHNMNKERGRSRSDRAIDMNEEYYIYQTMLSASDPEKGKIQKERERIRNHMIKAMRESEVHTSWTEPDSAHEEEVLHFIDRILPGPGESAFLSSFARFQKRISLPATLKSLAQLVLKMTCPGVPDIYQGSEFWNYSLTDPDNRREVDFSRMEAMLEEVLNTASAHADLLQLLEQRGKEFFKLYMTHKLLNLRKKSSIIMTSGEYVPVEVEGPQSYNAISFARKSGGRAILVAVPRFFASICNSPEELPAEEIWEGSRIMMPFGMRNASDQLSGQEIGDIGSGPFPLKLLLGNFPASVVAGEIVE